MGAGMVTLAQRYQFPLLILVSMLPPRRSPPLRPADRSAAFDPVLTKQRFMTAIGAPRYVPTLFGGGLEGA